MLLLPPKNFRGTLTKDLNCAKPLHEKCLKAGANGKQILNKFGFWETKTVVSEKSSRRRLTGTAFIFSGGRCACARRASAPAGT